MSSANRVSRDLQAAYNDTLQALAGTGSISVTNATMVALGNIRFDHQDGNIAVTGSSITSARVLVTGGGDNATGRTSIFNTNMRSQNTEIRMGPGSGIVMTGGSKIVQG
ncbi:MAG: hypothetical protein EXQ96_00470 [Alphaproteobacteria bacterium]|nr:hypothetical protein [Alphaproteobacteria bacterium]